MVRLYMEGKYPAAPVCRSGTLVEKYSMALRSCHKEVEYLHSRRCRSGDLDDIRNDHIVHCTPYRQRTLQIDRDIKHCVGVTVKPIKGFAQHYALVALE